MKIKNISIIIPAHNEETVIIKCLKSLMRQNSDYNLQIIVVCNGCQDNTYSIVKAFSPNIICLKTERASKTNALNLGDNVAKYYPRIYLDADIILSVNAIKEINSTFVNESCLATSIIPKMDMSLSSWFVRAFYDVWLNLSYCKAGMIGSGLYALSREGRERFQSFPSIIADDGYIRCLFKENERFLTLNCYATVTAPKNLMNLIKIKTRSRLGRYELQEKFPELLTNELKDYKTMSLKFLLNFTLWPKTIIYLFINVITRIRAKYQHMRKMTSWERDESSRH